MGRSKLLAAFAALLAACVSVASESGRACPCAGEYVCCETTHACITEGQLCPAADALDASADDARADAYEAPADAGTRLDSGACGEVPAPVVWLSFDDCDAGVLRDRVGSLVGITRGPDVRCESGEHPAVAFEGAPDGGSYVRVMDSADAAEHACTDTCRGVPLQFGRAMSIAAWLRIDGAQAFAHILGQWYVRDSYMLLTEGNDAGQRLELSLQTQDLDAGPLTIAAPAPVDAWAHWVATFGAGEARLYRDGVPVAEGHTSDAPLQCTDVPLELGQIGRQGPCGGDIDYAYFRGAIGDLRLYDRALTAREVASLRCDAAAHP